MPICAGVANPGTTLAQCTCDRRQTWLTKLRDAQESAQRAHAAVGNLGEDLRALREEHLRLQAYVRSRFGPLPWDSIEVKRGAGAPISDVRAFRPRAEPREGKP